MSPPGTIYTTDILDRETKDSYWLTVYATDRGVVPQFATIEVFIQVEDVNDNAPLTSEAMYHSSVMENSPEGLSVVQIQAQDPDDASEERLSYHIVSGNPQNFFSISTDTGEGSILRPLSQPDATLASFQSSFLNVCSIYSMVL